MSEDIVNSVIAKVEKMADANEEFENKDLQEFALTIQYLLKGQTRKEEVLALASAIVAVEEYKKGLQKRIEYAKLGELKEREATLLELLDQMDRELEMAVAMKIHEFTFQDNIADEIKKAILGHLEPTLGRGKWHAREEEAIQQIISKVMEGYLVVRVGT
ncbi:MAG: hypothetical protein JSV47_01260 [Deltaproteobacteria bacterium]|nr:MAG: hypothetical protein JSV47_01260 [Deltaproteobacteria bacterium]